MNTTLVVMAAGMATRYGGNKQITGMGPHGEILLEYSVCDALRAGFNKVVFIVRRDMVDTLKALCGDRLARRVDVRYAVQDYTSLPGWYTVPEGRTKPFGTVHAVLCARDEIGEPFAVINADDYYGVDAFQKMHDYLAALDDPGRAAMVGYRLRNTVSVHGTVTRGICRVENGRMMDVEEVQKIRLYPDGAIADISRGEPGVPLDPMSLVSMNFWGFSHRLFPAMQEAFDSFLRKLSPDDVRGEYPLPVMVDRLIKRDIVSIEVLKTAAVWFGVTYQEDRPKVQQALSDLHTAGIYGDRLF